jgi:hypothetical protein
MRLPSLSHLMLNLLYTLELIHSFQPTRVQWILLLNPVKPANFTQQALPDRRPRPERQIRIGTLGSDKPATPAALQAKLNDSHDAHYLIEVTSRSRRKLFWMEASEPCCLAVVRALP